MTTVAAVPRFDESERHPEDAATDWSLLKAYYRLREKFLGEAMPVDLEAAANIPLPAIG